MATEDTNSSLRRLSQAVAGPGFKPLKASPRLETLEIQRIRTDGETQCRVAVDSAVIDEYATLMRSGIAFPPIRVWFDGDCYWLADGFQRIAAAGKTGCSRIAAEVMDGTLADARWDSYASNSRHGLRRTRTDIEFAIRRALSHPNASTMSNSHIAQHLGIPEPTLRRWRKRLSPADNNVRRVTRRGGEYVMQISAIGHGNDAIGRRGKHRRDLEAELSEMKLRAADDVRCILNIIGNWAFGATDASDCLKAIDRVLERMSQRRT